MEEKKSYFKKINNSSVVQQVIDALTKAIIDKEFRPGDKIPTEAELSESLGVGRLSIREAVKVLVYYGVLEIRRPEGTFVCNGYNDSLIDPMLYGIILSSDDSYDYIKELRHLMEVGGIKLAIVKCSDEDKQKLLKKFDDFKKAVNAKPVDVHSVFGADNEFHRVISEMGCNPLLDRINALVRTLTHDMRYKTVTNMIAIGEGDTLLEAHKKICDLILDNQVDNIDEIVENGYFYNRVTL